LRILFRDSLVAIDGSVDAELTLNHAIDLAERMPARLTLLIAIAQPPRFGYWGLAAPGMFGFFERADAEAQRIAQHARDRVPDHLSVTTPRDPTATRLGARPTDHRRPP
jgi:nucleotide-binding universal stress UspA family protein